MVQQFRFFFACALLILVSNVNVSAQYCASNATSTFDSNVGAVTFNTINNSTLGVCATYSNFTAISTNITIGNSYSISVTAGTCGGSFTRNGKVYIDWNGNQNFTDPGEEVFAFGPTPPSVANVVFTGNVTVPVTAVIGSTRMRVVVRETGSLASVLPCGTFTWGEVEDYTVNIAPSSPNDIGVTAITAPSSGCNLSAAEQVSVNVTNFGTNSQAAWNVNYRVNNGPIVTEPMTGPLASGATLPYTFTNTANLSVPGTYTIKAWASLASDIVPQNDSTTAIVTGIPGVSAYPYVEDFESGNGGWIPGGPNSSWALGTPAKNTIIGAASGSNSYVTGGLGTGDYNSNEDSYVLGPCFDFSSLSNPWISLSIWWHSENNWDGTNLQASTDFGLTWQTVGQAFDPGNWYNNASIISTPGGDGNGWCGGAFNSTTGSNGWVTAAHRLDGLAGQPSVRLRLTFGSDGSVQDDGVAFDDIRISEGPVANLGADTLICTGDTLFLDAGPFAAYDWNTGGNSQVDTITGGAFVIVQVTDTNGFFDFDTVIVSISTPSVNLGPDSVICPGDTLVLDAGSASVYNWHDNSSAQTFFATTAGPKYVTITDSVGCTDTDTMNLILAIPPSLDLGLDTSVCAGSSVVLDAGGGPTGTIYQWSTGAQTQVLAVSSPGTYVAAVTTPGGCAAVDTIEVINFPSPGVNLGLDGIRCGTYLLDAGGGNTSFAWSTGANTQTVSLNAGGTYSVTVTNSFGCTEADTITITHGQQPTVALGPDQLLCNGQSITLDAGNPGSTYLWSTAANTQTINVTTPGVYIAVVIDPVGCEGSDTISITGSLLNVDLGPAQTICGNGGVILNAGNPGQSYAWSNGGTTQAIFVSTAGTYTVTVTDQQGCNATDNIQVNSVPGINAGITGPATGTLFQPVNFSDASSPNPISWLWRFGDGITSTQQNPQHTYQAFGVFTVTLIVSDGQCQDTTTSTIDINNVVSLEDELGATAFDLYPNPSSDVFTLFISLVKRKDMTVEVYDLNGRRVFADQQRAVQEYKQDISLGAFSKGIYLLKVQAEGAVVYRKLVLH